MIGSRSESLVLAASGWPAGKKKTIWPRIAAIDIREYLSYYNILIYISWIAGIA